MKKEGKFKWVKWGLALLPFLLVICFYSRLPAQIPMSWGLNGAVRFEPRWQIILVAGMSPLMAMLFEVLPKIDPRKKSYDKFRRYYDNFIIGILLFMLGIVGIIISESFFPGRISVSVATTLGLGLLFAFIGNMMPKMRSNYFMGIKTPWTLSSELVWNQTHRLAGWLWFFGGLGIAGSALVSNDTVKFSLVLSLIFIITLIPLLMSFVWYRREKSSDKERF